MESAMTICNPRAPLPGVDGALHRALDGLAGKVVGFIDNTKPNFNHLVDDLADVLVQKYGVRSVIKRGKRLQSIPAPEAVIAELVAACDLVITGSGD
jgi:hypothetical protein